MFPLRLLSMLCAKLSGGMGDIARVPMCPGGDGDGDDDDDLVTFSADWRQAVPTAGGHRSST